MTGEKDHPKVVRKCRACDNHTLHVRVAVIDGVPHEVGRCALCDVVPCPNCEGRTLDPTAQHCRHCNTHIGLKKKGDKPA